jgi:chromosomal replication initiation ATPase DnaA
MLRFHFSIRTRDGQKVDSIAIIGGDQEEAQRKLRQMYRQCDILRCEVTQKLAGDKQWQAAPLADALKLVANSTS